MKQKRLRNLILAAFFVALGFVLPNVTAHLSQMGRMFLPMHIPVLLCGFICGGPYGLIVGFALPLLSSAFTSMPILYPVAISMSFELAAYGLAAGVFYKMLPKKPQYIYLSLFGAMVVGRIVSGAATFLLLMAKGGKLTFETFLAGAVLDALPGIAIQIVFIPLIIIALQKAKLIDS